MISCSSWYCICSIVEYFLSSVVSILYFVNFLIDDIKKRLVGSTGYPRKVLSFKTSPKFNHVALEA